MSVAEAQQKARSVANSGGLNIQKEEGTGRPYIQVETSDFKKKVFAKVISDEELDSALKDVAEELPRNSQERLGEIAKIRDSCEAVVVQLEELNKNTKVPGCSGEPAATEPETRTSLGFE